jgi:hypothetical protein
MFNVWNVERKYANYYRNTALFRFAGSEDEVRAAEKSGNRKLNQIYEANLFKDPASKPLKGAHVASRERFAREKYIEARFYSREAHQQQIQMEDPSTPGSPSKSGSLMKFLKKESSQNSKMGKSSACSATADMTPISSDTKSIFQLPTVPLARGEMQLGSRSICPQVQIARKAAPALNDKDWAKVTRGARSERSLSSDTKSLFQLPTVQLAREEMQLGSRSICPQVQIARKEAPALNGKDSVKVTRGAQSERNLRSIDVRERNSRRPSRSRSYVNPVGEGPLSNSDGSMEISLGENDEDGSLRDGHSSAIIRKPDHYADPRRAAFNMSRSSASDLLEKDVKETDNKTSGNRPASPKRRLVAAAIMPTARNSRVHMYSANGRGRSTSKTRDKNGEKTTGQRPRSQSRGLGEKEPGRRARSSSRRRHVTDDELGAKRSSSRQKRREDNAQQNGTRRGRSTSRRRGTDLESTPKQHPLKQIQGFIDLTDSPKEPPPKKGSRRDAGRSRSRPRLYGRLDAYRNGTESPMRGVRVRNGRESPLRDGRRDRSRSSSRIRSSVNESTSRVEEAKPRSGRRYSSRGRLRASTVDKKSDGNPHKGSSERRARSATRKREEQPRPRQPRSKSQSAVQVGHVKTETSTRLTDATNASNRSLNIESGFSEHSQQAPAHLLENGEMSFQIVAECSNPDFGFSDKSKFLGETGNTNSFRKPYRKESKKKGGDAYEKGKRRISRNKLSEQILERASRRSGIIASIDREEDGVKTSSGPLMRRGNLSTTLLEDGARPFHMRGHVSLSVSELGNSHRNVLKSSARSFGKLDP